MAEPVKSCDMIVNLYALPEAKPMPDGVAIERAFAGDMRLILTALRALAPNWADEAAVALHQQPPTLFMAYLDGKPVGFACYDATAKGYFGPIGLRKAARGRHVGEALLLRTLEAMREAGYGYAVIGWAGDAAPFYQKTVNARFIEGGEPENTVYSRQMGRQKKRG